MSQKRLACLKIETKSTDNNSGIRNKRLLKKMRVKWLRKVDIPLSKFFKDYEY